MRGKTEENQIKLHFLSQPVEVELAFGFLCVSSFSAQIKGSRIYLGSWFQRVQFLCVYGHRVMGVVCLCSGF